MHVRLMSVKWVLFVWEQHVNYITSHNKECQLHVNKLLFGAFISTV